MTTDECVPDEMDARGCFLDGAAGAFVTEDWEAFLARVRRDAKVEALREAADYIDGAEPHHFGDSDLDPLDYNTLGEYGIDRAAEALRARANGIEKEN